MTEHTAQRPRLLTAIPFVLFAILAIVFYFALKSGDPSRIPSALIGKPVPAFSLAAVDGLTEAGNAVAGFAAADLARGRVTVVNVWASWCAPCHEEHPLLVVLKERSGVDLFGINYKDDPADARRFLGRYGNPFDRVGADRNGRTAVDWGVYGVPETFVVDGYGRIAFKHVGPITEQAIADILLPEIAKARSAKPPAAAAGG
ncbi:MAG: DsbE family thiol:disulfide interchange protein [Hyphomicrobiaceae bacterium]